MRKLIVQQWISADGFASDRSGTTSFFEDEKYNEGWTENELQLLKNIDTILLGANTYKMFIDYWPDVDPTKEPVGPALNNIPKVVFSKTLESAPWGNWKPATIVSEDAAQYVQNLKQQPGKDLILWGSLSLCSALAEAGLPDEYHLTIAPAFVGKGRHFLPEGIELTDMELFGHKALPTGVVLLKYRPRNTK
jgi:dihydrofolate reductase